MIDRYTRVRKRQRRDMQAILDLLWADLDLSIAQAVKRRGLSVETARGWSKASTPNSLWWRKQLSAVKQAKAARNPYADKRDSPGWFGLA